LIVNRREVAAYVDGVRSRRDSPDGTVLICPGRPMGTQHSVDTDRRERFARCAVHEIERSAKIDRIPYNGDREDGTIDRWCPVSQEPRLVDRRNARPTLAVDRPEH